MREREIRFLAVFVQHAIDDERQIAVELREIPNMALAVFGQLARRQTLPAPIERHYGKATGEQFAHDFEVFFDEFGATLNQQHGAMGLVRRANPTHRAQAHAITGGEPFDDRAGRRRIARHRHEVGKRPCGGHEKR